MSENAVLFLAYGVSQKAVAICFGKASTNDLSTLHNATAGGMAAFWASFVLCPTELVKCRLQVCWYDIGLTVECIHYVIRTRA